MFVTKQRRIYSMFRYHLIKTEAGLSYPLPLMHPAAKILLFESYVKIGTAWQKFRWKGFNPENNSHHEDQPWFSCSLKNNMVCVKCFSIYVLVGTRCVRAKVVFCFVRVAELCWIMHHHAWMPRFFIVLAAGSNQHFNNSCRNPPMIKN